MQNKFKFLLVLLLFAGSHNNNLIAMSGDSLAALITESGCFSPAALASCAELDRADRVVMGKNLIGQLLAEKSAMSAKQIASTKVVSNLLLSLSEEVIESCIVAKRANLIAIQAENIAEQARNNIHGHSGDVDGRRFAILTSLAKSREAVQARDAAKIADAYWQLSASTLPGRMASAIFDYKFKIATNAAISIQATMRGHKVRSGKAERLEIYRNVVRARRATIGTGTVDAR